MYDSASGHVTVTSQHNDLPLCQRTPAVTPSGLVIIIIIIIKCRFTWRAVI